MEKSAGAGRHHEPGTSISGHSYPVVPFREGPIGPSRRIGAASGVKPVRVRSRIETCSLRPLAALARQYKRRCPRGKDDFIQSIVPRALTGLAVKALPGPWIPCRKRRYPRPGLPCPVTPIGPSGPSWRRNFVLRVLPQAPEGFLSGIPRWGFRWPRRPKAGVPPHVSGRRALLFSAGPLKSSFSVAVPLLGHCPLQPGRTRRPARPRIFREEKLSSTPGFSMVLHNSKTRIGRGVFLVNQNVPLPCLLSVSYPAT